MESVNNLDFSSFLAGALLTRRSIANLDFSKLVAHFENQNNVDFTEYDSGYDRIHNLFYLDQNGFHLKYEYNDIIVCDNAEYRVYDYLYSFTNELVRGYFHIPENNDLQKENDFSHKKRRG